MNSKLFIADKIKVGFNPRPDTYTGLLGYVIGFDGKKWRKEPSWEGWRYKYVTDEDYESQKLDEYNRATANATQSYNHILAQKAIDYKGCSQWSIDQYKKDAALTLEQYILQRIGTYDEYEKSFKNISSNRKNSMDENIKPKEFENVPTEGFVLNKKVGGYSNGWDHRSTYCRVYDPRGFEFEINVPNLLYILEQCNSMKGKGLEGEFVYAWDGKDLVLLPTSSQEYVSSAKFTKLQSGKVSSKELVAGNTYKTKSMDDYIYLGRFNHFNNKRHYWRDKSKDCKKSHVFVSVDNPKNFYAVTSLTNFVQIVSDVPISNYAELYDNFIASDEYYDIETRFETEMEIETNPDKAGHFGDFYVKISDNQYKMYEGGANVDWVGGSTYYTRDRKRTITGYYTQYKGILTFKGNGEFTIKKVSEDMKNKLTLGDVKALNPLYLEVKTNNGNQKINF